MNDFSDLGPVLYFFIAVAILFFVTAFIRELAILTASRITRKFPNKSVCFVVHWVYLGIKYFNRYAWPPIIVMAYYQTTIVDHPYISSILLLVLYIAWIELMDYEEETAKEIEDENYKP